MDNIKLIAGSTELLDTIKPLWENLNLHHKSNSIHFKEKFDTFSFENRKSKFLNYPLIYILLLQDTKTTHYIGYCISTIDSCLIGEISSIYIEKSYRKYGLGSILMENSLNWLNNHKVKSKIIGVAAGNETAIEFYKTFGFFKRTTILQEV